MPTIPTKIVQRPSAPLRRSTRTMRAPKRLLIETDAPLQVKKKVKRKVPNTTTRSTRTTPTTTPDKTKLHGFTYENGIYVHYVTKRPAGVHLRPSQLQIFQAYGLDEEFLELVQDVSFKWRKDWKSARKAQDWIFTEKDCIHSPAAIKNFLKMHNIIKEVVLGEKDSGKKSTKQFKSFKSPRQSWVKAIKRRIRDDTTADQPLCS